MALLTLPLQATLEVGTSYLHNNQHSLAQQHLLTAYRTIVDPRKKAEAANNLAIALIEMGKSQQAIFYLEKCCNQTYNLKAQAAAQNNLAILLEDGAEGVEADPDRAKELFEAVSKQTYNLEAQVDAQYNLAGLLAMGSEGVKADPDRAKGLYEAVSKQTIKPELQADAQSSLDILISHRAE